MKTLAHVAAILVVLTSIAAIAPEPASTHRDFYQKMGRDIVVPECDDIHCFRRLSPSSSSTSPDHLR